MKKIILNEQQEQFLIKEFIQQGFSLAELDSLGNLAKQRFYCERYLGEPIGEGSSRVVFEIGDGEIIKVAKEVYNNTGLYQNKLEYSNYEFTHAKYPQLNDLFPKVFQIANDGSWLTCERVLPIEKTDFQTILGIPYHSNRIVMKDNPYKKYQVDAYEDEFGLELSVSEFIDWCELPEDYDDSDKRKYQELMKANNWFKLLYKYIKLTFEGKSGFTDLSEENFGIALRKGKPTVVILDNGFDKLTECISHTINDFLNENIETEYLDRFYGVPLKRYMNMSDNEKNEEWIYAYSYFVEGWVINTDLSYYGLSEEEIEDMEEGDSETYYNILSKYPEAMEDCVSFIQDKIRFSETPTFDVMDYTRDVHNEWLIHFSDNASQIAYQGFKYATEEMNDLGYSNAGSTNGKTSEGWDFAYLANECPRDGDKYGQDAVMFQASGIKATHYGDREEQVMFWNKDAKNIILIQNSKNSYDVNSRGDYLRNWFIKSTITGEVLYDAEDIDDVIAWVQNNFAQYRKHLIEPRESKMRHRAMQDSIHTQEMNYQAKKK